VNNNELDRQIDELERFLAREDPSLSEQFNKLERESAQNAVSVFSLLVASVVLLGIGLATMSLVAFGSGVAAFVASFLVDGVYQRSLTNRGSRGQDSFGASKRTSSATTSSPMVTARELHPSRRPSPFPGSSGRGKTLMPLFASVDPQPQPLAVPAHGGMSCTWTYRHRPRSVRCLR
jgi:hypothetical protein